jgi:hypothetical protein
MNSLRWTSRLALTGSTLVLAAGGGGGSGGIVSTLSGTKFSAAGAAGGPKP